MLRILNFKIETNEKVTSYAWKKRVHVDQMIAILESEPQKLQQYTKKNHFEWQIRGSIVLFCQKHSFFMKTITFVMKPALTIECRKVWVVNISWHHDIVAVAERGRD